MKKDTAAKILIFLFCLFYLSSLSSFHMIEPGDTGAYILLAKSLSLGQGYRAIWSAGNLAYTKAPFMFPVLLTPIIYLFGYNFLIMRLLCVIFAVGSLHLIYLLFKRISDESMALLVLILTGFSSQFFYYSQQILTEIPYLFFSLLAIIFIERFKYEEKFFNKTLFFASSFIIVSYFTRYIGVSLVAAFLMYLLFEKRLNQNLRPSLKNVIILGLLMVAPILLWELRNYSLSGGERFAYLQEFLSARNPLNVRERFSLLEIIIHSIYAYVFYAYPKILVAVQFTQRNLIAFMLTAITFGGFLFCLVKKRTILEYYIIFYILMLFFWSWSVSSGARFLVPIIPFIFYYFIIGLRGMLELVKVKKYFRKGLLIFLVGILLIFNIKESILFAVDKERMSGYSQQEIEDFLDMVEWAKDNTSSNSILASSVESPIYLYFQRKTVFIPYIADDLEMFAVIYNNKVNYILISPIYPYTIQYLKPIIMRNLDRFIEVYRKNENIIYRVKNL